MAIKRRRSSERSGYLRLLPLAIPLLAGCAQQVPVPQFPENGVSFGGPTVDIGKPTIVACPYMRPDGTHASFETEAAKCNELLLANSSPPPSEPEVVEPPDTPAQAPEVGGDEPTLPKGREPIPEALDLRVPPHYLGGACYDDQWRQIALFHCVPALPRGSDR